MGLLGFFIDLILAALGSTQPLTAVGTRDISWGLRRPVRKVDILTTFMLRFSINSGNLNLLKPQRPVKVCNRKALPCYAAHEMRFARIILKNQ
jgi:hypothetical protein